MSCSDAQGTRTTCSAVSKQNLLTNGPNRPGIKAGTPLHQSPWGSLCKPSAQLHGLKSSTFLLLVAMPGAPFVASLLLVAMPFVPSSFLLQRFRSLQSLSSWSSPLSLSLCTQAKMRHICAQTARQDVTQRELNPRWRAASHKHRRTKPRMLRQYHLPGAYNLGRVVTKPCILIDS